MTILNGSDPPAIIDIRRGTLDYGIVEQMRDMLHPRENGEKQLPTLLLYDEAGLKLFEDITYLDEYYLTNAEIEVLEKHADEITAHIQSGSTVVELGSGNLRKVRLLLEALEKAGKEVSYYALDLSGPELERTLNAVQGVYRHVKCYGLLGTYDDGLAWLKSPEIFQKPKAILWMGSSIGNLKRPQAADFLRGFTDILKDGDTMILGVDGCQSRSKVFGAYNDKKGVTRDFILNGLLHANQLLGKSAFDLSKWIYLGEYDAEEGRHQAFVSPTEDVTIAGSVIKAGERVRIEESYKYSPVKIAKLWSIAGLVPHAKYGLEDYHVHVVTKPPFVFPSKPEKYAASPTPSLAEFEQLWIAWDLVTRHMIPEQEMTSKPINLRNACIFYLGHIPAFLDMHLTNATGKAPTEPAFYHAMFERGIDPDVDNPQNCHAHSEIPDEWPSLEEILVYQGRVRARTRSLYETSNIANDHRIGRAIWLGFEHEVMHLETLLYMLLQSDKTLPPTKANPDFKVLAQRARQEYVPNTWIEIPATSLSVGMDDPEDGKGPARFYGWDIEKPKRQVDVHAFEAKARPLTNEDYGRFLEQSGKSHIPASWATSTDDKSLKLNGFPHADGSPYRNGEMQINGTTLPLTDAFMNGKFVRTVYGPVPLKEALHWPVFASYDELADCATFMNGRIPTADEARSIYSYAEVSKSKEADSILTRKISAVNGHLSNEGIEISPPSIASQNGVSGADDLNPYHLFADLGGCNVGFKNFHPMPVTQNGSKLSGQGELGGVWEWTSSVLERVDGYEAGKLYPAYSSDFFDGKHNIVLGGSWATHPRVAGRKTFVNWYQRNYPYAWCGARLVRDIQ